MEITKVTDDKKTEELKESATDLAVQAGELTIDTAEQYGDGVALLDLLKEFRREVKTVWDPVCDTANKAHKAATAARRTQDEPFEKAERQVKDKLDIYNREQERLREIEAKRIRDEEAEAARLLKEEEERLLEEAVEYEDRGDYGKADEMVEEAQEVQEHREARPLFVPPPVDRGGMSFRDNWKAVIMDPMAVPREYCIPDQHGLDALAKERAGGPAPAGVKFINNRVSMRR